MSVVLLAVSLLTLCPVPAGAAFVGSYATDQFQLVNNNANGYVITPEGGLSILLVGGNNGSGSAGDTDFTILAAGSGVVRFEWLYGSADTMAGMDAAGYLIGDVFTKLADDPTADLAVAEFHVVKNQRFGFRVSTVDNTYGAGMLQVSAFQAPSAQADSATPEPGTIFSGIALLLLGWVKRRRSAVA